LKLSEVLTEPAVVLDLRGPDKWHLIGTLTDSLVASRQIVPGHRDRVLDALLSRERSMSTGMENGIAIPHTSVAEVEHTAVALGISSAGVDFHAIDGRPTHLIMLLVNPSNRTKAHIRTLAEIARLLSSSELRQGLQSATSVQVVLDRIREAEATVT